jgi:hypothetical protein
MAKNLYEILPEGMRLGAGIIMIPVRIFILGGIERGRGSICGSNHG